MAAGTTTQPSTAPTTTDSADTPADILKAQLLRTIDEARAITDAAIAGERELTDSEHKSFQDLMLKADGLEARLKRAKQKDGSSAAGFRRLASDLGSVFDAPNSGGPSAKVRGASWGRAVVESLTDARGGFKGITPSGSILVNVPAPEPIAFGRPVNSVLSLIPAVQTEGEVRFLRQNLRQNNAAVVPAGALKPTSIYEFESVVDRVRVIAHLSQPISRMDLADSALLAQFVREELLFGLESALINEVLNGDGTGEHFRGLAATPGILTVALIGPTAHEKLVTLRRAVTRLENNGLEGSGWIMSPGTWEDVETLATTDGSPIVQGSGQTTPIDAVTRRLYGQPVVTSVACPPNVVYYADFVGSTRLFVKDEARIDFSQDTYDPTALGGDGASDFLLNLCRWRVEGRWAFGVLRPTGVVKVSLT